MATDQVLTSRDLVIFAARSWLKTPFHMGACVKGSGVDCGTLLTAVYSAAGCDVPTELGHFSKDWHLHTAEDRYLDFIESYARPVEAPLPGDIAMFRMKRAKVFSHGAIVIEWPKVIHAFWGHGVEEADASIGALKWADVRFYSPWT